MDTNAIPIDIQRRYYMYTSTIPIVILVILAFMILTIRDLIKYLIKRRRFKKTYSPKAYDLTSVPFPETLGRNLRILLQSILFSIIYIIYELSKQ
jgi:hypothetical protein